MATCSSINLGRIAANIRTVESLPDDAHPWLTVLATDLRTVLSALAAKKRECEELVKAMRKTRLYVIGEALPTKSGALEIIDAALEGRECAYKMDGQAATEAPA